MAILTIITVQATTNEIHLADDGFMMAELLDSEAAHVTHQGLTFEDGHIYAQAEDRSLIQQETQHSNSNEQENQHQHEHEHEHEASHESEHESDASTEQEQEGIGRLLKNKIQPKLKALKAKAGNFFKGLKGKAKNGIAKLLSAAVKPKASVPANPLVLAAQKAQQAAQEAQMKLQIQQQAQAKKEAEAKAAAAKKVADDAKKAAAVAAAAAAAAAKFAAKPPTPAGASGASTKPPTEMDLALAKLEANMAKKLGVKVKAVMERGVTRFVPLDAESAIRLQDWKRQRAERKRRERRAKEKARRRAEKKARREAKKARIAKEEAEKKAAEEAAIKKAEEERAARIAKYRKAKAVRDNLPNFSAHVPLPIPDPFIFKTPAPLKAGEVAIQQCSNEGRRRINMCINLMGSIMIPNENNQITFEEEHILNSCSNPKRSKPLSSGDQSTCRKLRAHIFNVADVRQLHQAIRLDDVHNVCVRVLGTDFNGQVWLSPEDGSQCHLSGLPERQNEGVTGSRCLFLHGSGVPSLKYDELNSRKGPYDGFLPSFPLYWKGVEKQFGSQCDKRFYVTETINRGWDDGSLQTEYCAAIQKFRPHTIFAHSTANNVLAAGIANNVTGCHLIAKAGTQPVSGQALWFGMNGAFKGTPLADVLKEQCAKVDGPTKSWYAGVCAAEYATPYHGFDALATTHINKAAISMTDDEKFGRPQFDCKADGIVNHFDPDEAIRKDCVSLPSIAAEYQSGSMCGVAPDAFTKTLHRFNAKSKTTFLKDDSITVEWGRDSMSKATRDLISGHDGLVPFASCRVPGRVYGLSPASTFYATTTNHDDGRCANGEGGSTLQQPCTWLTSRLVEGQTKFEKLQQFRDGRIVGVAPRATPLAPDFGSFRYDEEELKVSIQQRLTSFEEKAAVAQPVGSTVRRVIRRRRQRRPPPPIQPAQVIANQTDPAQEKKLRDDAAIKAEANLKAYLAAAA